MVDTPSEAKRKQVVLLRMDGVSAFTVPSLSSNDSNTDHHHEGAPSAAMKDTVHWKIMKSTSFADPRHATGNVQSDPPSMRMAIKDFQIKAQYIFWTDITTQQARHMHVEWSKDDLVCSFKLDLPVIVVDILSLQFYAIMNVVRNVLLVPPPASARSHNPSQADLDKETKQVLELHRDFETSATNKLDIAHKHCRDEIKDVIEKSWPML